MSIEIEGDVIIMVADPYSRDEVLIWTIGDDLVALYIDSILEKFWLDQYARFKENCEVTL